MIYERYACFDHHVDTLRSEDITTSLDITMQMIDETTVLAGQLAACLVGKVDSGACTSLQEKFDANMRVIKTHITARQCKIELLREHVRSTRFTAPHAQQQLTAQLAMYAAHVCEAQDTLFSCLATSNESIKDIVLLLIDQ